MHGGLLPKWRPDTSLIGHRITSLPHHWSMEKVHPKGGSPWHGGAAWPWSSGGEGSQPYRHPIPWMGGSGLPAGAIPSPLVHASGAHAGDWWERCSRGADHWLQRHSTVVEEWRGTPDGVVRMRRQKEVIAAEQVRSVKCTVKTGALLLSREAIFMPDEHIPWPNGLSMTENMITLNKLTDSCLMLPVDPVHRSGAGPVSQGCLSSRSQTSHCPTSFSYGTPNGQ